MSNKPKIFSDLERIAELIPAPLFWSDKNAVGLGCNGLVLEAIGVLTNDELIGKGPYDYLPKDMADVVIKNINQVLAQKKSMVFEEQIKNRKTGEIQYLLMTRAPLFDDNGVNVVGSVVSATDITDRKKLEQARIEKEQFEKFKKIVNQAANETKSPLGILLLIMQQCNGFTREQIYSKLHALIPFIPVNFYWLDTNFRVVAVTHSVFEAMKLKRMEDCVGKNAYDLFPYDMADHMIRHHKQVMSSRKVLSQEETYLLGGVYKHYLNFKAPLYDDQGNPVGLIGTSVDTTLEKEAQRLAIENAEKNTIIAEHEKFAKIAKQFAHDITGAIGNLANVTNTYREDLPEEGRVALTAAKTTIEDVSYALLAGYNERNKLEHDARESKRPVLISLTLLDLLIEKRNKYKGQSVEFKTEFGPKSKFAFIKSGPSAFKRMMSNLINNAVDAFDGKGGEVIVKLMVDDKHFTIIVQDNGKGIPNDVLEKIKKNIVVTHGKEDGHGIGMGQIYDTVRDNAGEIDIATKVGKGTTITLTFPTIPVPDWAATEISLHHGDTIIILDDDPSVHAVWDMRFKPYVDLFTIKHFTQGDEAIAFINDPCFDKENMVLLTDYELLKQKRNGLEVMAATKVPRSFLVTSHFACHRILEVIKKAHAKMLPKSLVGEVEIKIVDKKAPTTRHTNVVSTGTAAIVIVEDHQGMADSLAALLKRYGKTTDVYYDGITFIENFAKYPKDTKICLDYSLGSMNGIDIAKKLHAAGYTELFLLTGWDRDSFGEDGKEVLPDYLTMILKTDSENIRHMLVNN